ncbi:hypothetical protein AB835_09685 [Candidatus Endobugula sertula]|uniref:Rhodanese domain-containing protein n=1 Tax=Candidatus Endobugula sertula TaxID=62101 RepID=A0A1D2QNY7_9GAMM|nr:hypothetical protein AB835_09685 [Candidatus Endobugula sertula]
MGIMDIGMKRIITFLCLSFLILSGIAYAVISSRETSTPTFVTWESLEPDKWSSIWLIKHYIDPQAVIEVYPTGDPLGQGVMFGVPQADYKRSNGQSTFESLLVGFNQQDPVLKKLGSIITTIETTAWNVANDPWVHTVEQNFRRLQDRYSRIYVPVSCYGHFFDVLYQNLSVSADPNELNQSLRLAVNNQSCQDVPAMAERQQANRVVELTIDQLLAEIAFNKQVVFVDTREPEEFAKSHIPGAVNIPMRDLNQSIYHRLKKADRVISYCVKDFRGYEVARQMLDNGVNNVAVMKPHGFSGWQSSGLPITSDTLPDDQAKVLLNQCARDQQLCKTL